MTIDKYCFCACVEQLETGECDCTRRMKCEVEETIRETIRKDQAGEDVPTGVALAAYICWLRKAFQ